MPDDPVFDCLFLGAYTRDTIWNGTSRRTVDGGAFYFGASVAARMGLRVAAVTRMAPEDGDVLAELRSLGVAVEARPSHTSTRLDILYPSTNPDERVIRVRSSAGPFSPNDLGSLRARIAIVGASFRGEVGEDVLATLVARQCAIALDAQGFVRALRDGVLCQRKWPEAERLLPRVSILKADVNEAETLTGSRDFRAAASIIRSKGAAEALITSKEGVLAADQTGYHEAVFLPRRVVGRSGRGDTCLAAYAARRLTHPAAEAVIWAAAVTSIKLETDGPFRGGPAEVESRAEEIRSAIRSG
ncbi:MAG TPA: PfkB family carbohydrate kinase [Spirochaetia bacterium]|nr:PfkB family carbohydrate kinase [Spirochaetia bacterium]